MKEDEVIRKIRETLYIIENLGYKEANEHFQGRADTNEMSNADLVISASLIACIQVLTNQG